MRILGFEVTRAKSNPVFGGMLGGFLGYIREGFAGAWQRGILTPDDRATVLAFSAVYACVDLVASDIGKLGVKLVQESGDICSEVAAGSPYWRILQKPNGYQTMLQFMQRWIASKLLFGNAYVYLERNDLRGIPTQMHVLHPLRVVPRIADDGSVWYDIGNDPLAQTPTEIRVPASEVMHDRGICLFHPLVGVSPIFACGSSATHGARIQNNSARFFENMSRPSGMLTAPGAIPETTATRLKQVFEENFAGAGLGRLFVGGDGLKYEPMTIPAQDAQLIEQLRWTVEDVARAFHVPLHKIGAAQNVTFSNIGQLNQDYYSQTLQVMIEAIEALLDDGLQLPSGMHVEFDLDDLLRMDPLARAEANAKAIGAGYLTPNEARAGEDLPPVPGGDTPYLQVQNYSLSALAKRDAASPAAAPIGAPTKGAAVLDIERFRRRAAANARKAA